MFRVTYLPKDGEPVSDVVKTRMDVYAFFWTTLSGEPTGDQFTQTHSAVLARRIALLLRAPIKGEGVMDLTYLSRGTIKVEGEHGEIRVEYVDEFRDADEAQSLLGLG